MLNNQSSLRNTCGRLTQPIFNIVTQAQPIQIIGILFALVVLWFLIISGRHDPLDGFKTLAGSLPPAMKFCGFDVLV